MLGAVDLGLAMLLSLVAGLAAGVGALPVLFLSRLSARAGAFCLGLGAGVMIGAAAFSLAAPAVALASAQYGRGAGAGLVAGGTPSPTSRTRHAIATNHAPAKGQR